MKRLIDNIIRHFTVLSITGSILFSGSSFFVINSVLESTIECCCIDNSSPGQSESYNCGENCCTITYTESQDIVGSLPNNTPLKDYTHNLNITNYTSDEKHIVKYTFSENHLKNNPQKIFLIISVFRI